MPESSSASTRAVRLSRAPAGIGPAYRAWVLSSLRTIARACGVQVQIDGASSAQSHDGRVSFKVSPGAGAAAECQYSWTPTLVGNVSGNDHVTLNVGTFNNSFLVTIDDADGGGDTDILDDPPPKLAIPDTGLQIVYLEVTGSLVSTAASFVTGFTVSSATIKVGTSVPASTSTVRRLELFRWQAGALVNQARRYNLGLFVHDDGTSTGVGVYTFTVIA